MRCFGWCLVFGLLLVVSSWGCGAGNRNNLLAIDSLALELKKADSLLGTLDVERAIRVSKAAKAACDTLQNSHALYPYFRAVQTFEGPETDTITPQESRIQERRHQMAQQVLYTFAQLKNLRHDVQAELLKGQDLQAHLKSEQKAVAHLYEYILQKQGDYRMRFHTYDSLQNSLFKLHP